MTREAWMAELTAAVAGRIRRLRKERGLTGEGLAEACSALGVPVPRNVIANLETGRRTTIDLPELLVLARALEVPPITLLFPLGETPTVTVLPGWDVPVWDAVAWFTGEEPLDEAPPKGSPREVLETFRAHADAVAVAMTSTRQAQDRRRRATTTLDPDRRAALLATAAQYEELALTDCRELKAARAAMRQRGLTPPALPTELAFIDETEAETSSTGGDR
ncbi:helix-turn-helix domain-containing protein [Allostreptomyces psammosilenae]|uniref:Transcriptional regulator with XRE-family HTH domain n=1 Tax=Allostreptomyces psammosilenae TaxID=1892865 RepID=A0A852ZQ73_9ACTN|nr:helix-turn-helix transcriptional regulator [Allostreptomyces psammosilenae]NYI03420.1 transcriptional regulator with XRE-family HTH domain [Allostreptomyces psammosilenae]